MNRIETQRHPLAILPGLLALAVGFFGFVTVFLLLFWLAPEAVTAQILCQLAAFFLGLEFIYEFLAWQAYSVVVTPECVTEKWGILFRYSRNYNLAGAIVDTHQGPIGRLLDTGDLVITLVHNSEVIHIKGLAEFRTVCHVLESRLGPSDRPLRTRQDLLRPT